MIKGGKFASSLPPSPYSREVSWRVVRNIMPIGRGCSDEKKKGKEKKKALRMHKKHDTGPAEKENPGHDLWETILAMIYDFPAASARCLPRVARGREGKSFKGTYLASENSSQCQFLKRNQGGELVHIQIYALRLDVKRVTYLSVGMEWTHCPIKGYKLG